MAVNNAVAARVIPVNRAHRAAGNAVVTGVNEPAVVANGAAVSAADSRAVRVLRVAGEAVAVRAARHPAAAASRA